ncbi:hypothetical protein NDU88_002785 [Pleurodeles waltl]|uniref:Uncharacterized protein n=1 Tax=Pleurodeles waltl TaxID=8319 RepID=A0AAV7UC37_PLEWA|nr:hypothetical protein NDU88_002785 [Pleurodeles waltl]
MMWRCRSWAGGSWEKPVRSPGEELRRLRCSLSGFLRSWCGHMIALFQDRNHVNSPSGLCPALGPLMGAPGPRQLEASVAGRRRRVGFCWKEPPSLYLRQKHVYRSSVVSSFHRPPTKDF